MESPSDNLSSVIVDAKRTKFSVATLLNNSSDSENGIKVKEEKKSDTTDGSGVQPMHLLTPWTLPFAGE
jgi:hypothetical protein